MLKQKQAIKIKKNYKLVDIHINVSQQLDIKHCYSEGIRTTLFNVILNKTKHTM